MSDESLYNMGKEVGALLQQVSDQGKAIEAIREGAAADRRRVSQQFDDHNHGALEDALERAGLIEWMAEEECWRVVPAVVAVVRPDKMEEEEQAEGDAGEGEEE